MNPIIEESLVVDASFTSRRELIDELSGSGLSRNVHEAMSVKDGLEQLGLGTVDACIIGPSVSVSKSLDFVRSSAKIEAAKGCAFLAVVSPGNNYMHTLASNGVHGMLDRPYRPKVFRHVLNEAVRIAREAHFKEIRDRIGSRQWSIDELQAEERLYQQLGPLHETLQRTAQEIRRVAHRVNSGELGFHMDGTPLTATNEEIRIAIEKALPLGETSKKTESFDQLFVASLVEWFSDHMNRSRHEATTQLRRRLLSFYQSGGK